MAVAEIRRVRSPLAVTASRFSFMSQLLMRHCPVLVASVRVVWETIEWLVLDRIDAPVQ